MSAATEIDLLYPLSLFHQNGGAPLPDFTLIEGETVPEPYRRLLVHTGDMTSRLEAFHAGSIVLTVLHREKTPQAYRREVVLRMRETGLPVEYGANEIDLAVFSPELRQAILEEHLPLGGLLNTHRVRYHSRPKAFLHLESDAIMAQLFQVPPSHDFYGRCNELLDEQERVLARIVEVLRP